MSNQFLPSHDFKPFNWLQNSIKPDAWINKGSTIKPEPYNKTSNNNIHDNNNYNYSNDINNRNSNRNNDGNKTDNDIVLNTLSFSNNNNVSSNNPRNIGNDLVFAHALSDMDTIINNSYANSNDNNNNNNNNNDNNNINININGNGNGNGNGNAYGNNNISNNISNSQINFAPRHTSRLTSRSDNTMFCHRENFGSHLETFGTASDRPLQLKSEDDYTSSHATDFEQMYSNIDNQASSPDYDHDNTNDDNNNGRGDNVNKNGYPVETSKNSDTALNQPNNKNNTQVTTAFDSMDLSTFDSLNAIISYNNNYNENDDTNDTTTTSTTPTSPTESTINPTDSNTIVHSKMTKKKPSQKDKATTTTTTTKATELKGKLESGTGLPLNRREIIKIESQKKFCSRCKTMDTSLWRYNSNVEKVCNACWLYARKYKKERPVTLNNRVVARRHSRKSSSKKKNKDTQNQEYSNEDNNNSSNLTNPHGDSICDTSDKRVSSADSKNVDKSGSSIHSFTKKLSRSITKLPYYKKSRSGHQSNLHRSISNNQTTDLILGILEDSPTSSPARTGREFSEESNSSGGIVVSSGVRLNGGLGGSQHQLLAGSSTFPALQNFNGNSNRPMDVVDNALLNNNNSSNVNNNNNNNNGNDIRDIFLNNNVNLLLNTEVKREASNDGGIMTSRVPPSQNGSMTYKSATTNSHAVMNNTSDKNNDNRNSYNNSNNYNSSVNNNTIINNITGNNRNHNNQSNNRSNSEVLTHDAKGNRNNLQSHSSHNIFLHQNLGIFDSISSNDMHNSHDTLSSMPLSSIRKSNNRNTNNTSTNNNHKSNNYNYNHNNSSNFNHNHHRSHYSTGRGPLHATKSQLRSASDGAFSTEVNLFKLNKYYKYKNNGNNNSPDNDDNNDHDMGMLIHSLNQDSFNTGFPAAQQQKQQQQQQQQQQSQLRSVSQGAFSLGHTF